MPDAQLTKHALSAAMKKLMAERPMKKIKIKDIVEQCNMNRQSFYYHFKDKYDLVNWIFYTDFYINIKNSPDKTGWNLLEETCKFFYDNRVFYINAFQVTGQNSFSEYFYEMMHPLIRSHCEELFENDINKDFYANFYADAYRVAITRWLLEGAKIPPSEFVELIKATIIGTANLREDQNLHL